MSVSEVAPLIDPTFEILATRKFSRVLVVTRFYSIENQPKRYFRVVKVGG